MAFTKGKSGNPSGLTKEQAEAKRVMALWIGSEKTRGLFQAAYTKALEDGNATIILDCANRLMGKVKDELELGESEERPLKGLAVEKLLAIADALKP
jgi:hypothetical protein